MVNTYCMSKIWSDMGKVKYRVNIFVRAKEGKDTNRSTRAGSKKVIDVITIPVVPSLQALAR